MEDNFENAPLGPFVMAKRPFMTLNAPFGEASIAQVPEPGPAQGRVIAYKHGRDVASFVPVLYMGMDAKASRIIFRYQSDKSFHVAIVYQSGRYVVENAMAGVHNFDHKAAADLVIASVAIVLTKDNALAIDNVEIVE